MYMDLDPGFFMTVIKLIQIFENFSSFSYFFLKYRKSCSLDEKIAKIKN